MSSAIGVLLRGSNFAWDYGAKLTQAIFDGGTLISQARLAKATQEELTADYRLAAPNAFSNVEAAPGQPARNRTAEDHLVQEVTSAWEAFGIPKLQSRPGATDDGPAPGWIDTRSIVSRLRLDGHWADISDRHAPAPGIAKAFDVVEHVARFVPRGVRHGSHCGPQANASSATPPCRIIRGRACRRWPGLAVA